MTCPVCKLLFLLWLLLILQVSGLLPGQELQFQLQGHADLGLAAAWQISSLGPQQSSTVGSCHTIAEALTAHFSWLANSLTELPSGPSESPGVNLLGILQSW